MLDVNLMGVIRCTKAVMPHMRAARRGHIVTVGSVGGLIGQPFNEVYCAAKFGVEGFMEAMASYITPTFGITFTTVEPGGIRTEFVANVMKQIAASRGLRDDEYAPVLQRYIGGSASRQESGAYQTPNEVAAVVMQVVEAPDPPIRIRTAPWSEALCHLKTDAELTGRRRKRR